MPHPIHTTFRHAKPTQALDWYVREQIGRLHLRGHRLLGVEMSLSGNPNGTGGPYLARVVAHIPEGTAVAEQGSPDEYLAIRDAFDVLRRRLTYVQRRNRVRFRARLNADVQGS